MRYIIQLLLLAGICFCGIGCITGHDNCLMSENLEAWEYYLADPQVELQDVWSLENKVIICKGTPLGYLYTKRVYSDFVLKLDWRWPPGGKPGKGGVLVRMTGDHRIWPMSLEAQLNAGGAGDFWGLLGYQLAGSAERMQTIDHEEFGRLTNLKKTENLEKPTGEWNTYEIIAKGDTVTLIINGQEVNRATGCDLNPGRICLTSEGDEIRFRNIEIIPIN